MADTALKTANSGYLTRRLVDVSQDSTVTEYDCNATDGIIMTPLVEGGEIVEPLGDRLLGRVVLTDVLDPLTGEVLVTADTVLDEKLVSKIDEAGVDRVEIRSVLTCQAERGICAKCYGRDLARGQLVSLGETVGVMAAQSIGEPGTQLTMRTFHIGGTASRRVEQSTLESRHEGIVTYKKVKIIKNREGRLVVASRNGQLIISDANGREKENYRLTYGAYLAVAEGAEVKKGTMLAEWDPYTVPIITEIDGRIGYGDLVEGVTISERVDDVTGLSQLVVIPSKDPDLRPRLSIKAVDRDETLKLPDSDTEARYMLPIGANIVVAENAQVVAGDVIAKIPRETTKTKDITGGLPRVAELFEVRKPKECAVVNKVDGVVSFGKDTRGKRRVIVTPEVGEPVEYLIPKGKHITVLEGDEVLAGDTLMDGSSSPHDILQVMGIKALAKYLVDEIQEVYRLQGVKINDKHIEVIVRQMLRKVRVTNVGDSMLLVGEPIEKQEFEKINAKIKAEGGTPAEAEPMLLGITKASLTTESFISAASFQETTRVLTGAAAAGKIDHLKGLKENVIMGRLIPAGTGFHVYNNRELSIVVDKDDDGLEESGSRAENREQELAS